MSDFMATVTSANETTGTEGHRHTFRPCYSAWMGGKALGTYLRKNFPVSIYQRINADGDMMNVCTSKPNAKGQRAVGSHIHHKNPDGGANEW